MKHLSFIFRRSRFLSTTAVEEASKHSKTVSLDRLEATRLVDQLLQETRALMSNHVEHHVIAFSGGVDSSLVTALIQNSRLPHQQVTAVMGISPAVPRHQVDLAQTIAQHMGVDFELQPTQEGLDSTYVANQGQACLACKTHLYTAIQAVVSYAGDTRHLIYNGTNADDLEDPTRLGLIAADQFNVKSPLRQITKQQVRTASRHLGLPNWNHAASPCLRSRLAVGVPATWQHLHRIEQAELYVKNQLLDLVSVDSNLRVRLLARNRACIEVDPPILRHVVDKLDEWQDYFCENLQFASVQARAFKSGSVAKTPSK